VGEQCNPLLRFSFWVRPRSGSIGKTVGKCSLTYGKLPHGVHTLGSHCLSKAQLHGAMRPPVLALSWAGALDPTEKRKLAPVTRVCCFAAEAIGGRICRCCLEVFGGHRCSGRGEGQTALLLFAVSSRTAFSLFCFAGHQREEGASLRRRGRQ